MLRTRIAVASIAVASALGALLFVRGSSRSVVPAHPAPNAEPPPSVTHVDRARVRSTPPPVRRAAEAAAPNPSALADLKRGLASEDEATRIAAVEAAVSATSIDTLPELERFDLRSDPETAPTVIHAVALLGASAEGEAREHASATLARWLSEERRRDGADAVGNVSNLVEALGEVGGDGAVDALVSALDRADMPLHLEALAVQQLGELRDARARGAIERFAARVAKLPPAEGLDEELRVEAIDAAKDALAHL